MAGLAAARMSGDSEFHAAGPACEKARSPNLGSQPRTCCRKPIRADDVFIKFICI